MGEAEAPATKACPFCGEQILAVAIKCRHCSSILDGSAVQVAAEPPCRQCGSALEPLQQCPRCKALRTAQDAMNVPSGTPCRKDKTPLIDIFQCPKCKALRIPSHLATTIAAAEEEAKKVSPVRTAIGVIVLVVILLMVVSAIASTCVESASRRQAELVAPPATRPVSAVQEPSAVQPSEPALSISQRQAVGKARNYLDMGGFSRKGLIHQLVFEGFNEADAAFAADGIAPDWNAQAALKAKSYLDMGGFSRKALIHQLVFEGFTKAQAEFGAKAVGY